MHLSLFFARRYLFSRKRVKAINIISSISVFGVAFGTAALFCVLAVSSGFRDLIGNLFTVFDAEIEVVPVAAKWCEQSDSTLQKIASMPEVEHSSACYTDNALILFRGRPTVITLKGVDDNYDKVTDIRDILYGDGRWRLHQADLEFGIPGIGLAAQMGGYKFGTLQICAPRKGERINLLNPIESLSVADLTSADVCFNVNQRKYDASYMLCSLGFAQRLFEQEGRITSLELRLRPDASVGSVKKKIEVLGGGRFRPLDRWQQQEETFSVMQIEKFATYLFLSFILLIVCFNIIGSISMLMIDKRGDVATLRSLGASSKLIRRIFLHEGFLISLLGVAIGMLTGWLICWSQQTFGWLKFGGSAGSFIVDAYPVSLNLSDALLVLCTVVCISFVCVGCAVHYLSRRFL